ncbi:MAG: polysaccharide biosynthesis C-terminal domain-containing protein [Cyclobacteriaceae bacterium]
MSFKKLITSFSIYTGVSVFGSAAGFILMPILTHYLSTDEYGTLTLFNTYVQLLVPFIGLVASGLISVDYFKKDIGTTDFGSLFSSITAIPIAPFLFFFSTTLLFNDVLVPVLDIPGYAIITLPFVALLSVYKQQFIDYLIVLKKARLYAVINISKTTIEYGVAILLVVFLGYGWFGRVGSAVLVLVIIVIFSLRFYRSLGLYKRIQKSNIRSALLYGLPLIPHVVGRFVINQSDKLFIANMVSKSEVGIYNTGYMLGSMIMILSGAFLNIYTPYLFERLAAINNQKKFEILRLSYTFIGGMILTLLILSTLAPIFYSHFIENAFESGLKYVVWTGLSYVFWGIYLVFSGYIYYLKKTYILAYMALFNVTINLGLNYILIAKFGTIGASYATCISYFLVAIFTILISNRIYPMPWFRFQKIFENNK